MWDRSVIDVDPRAVVVYEKLLNHDDVIKWKHLPRYWPFVRGIHRSPHKGQWRGAFMFSLICAWINLWVNNREADDLRRYRARYDVSVMMSSLMYSEVDAPVYHQAGWHMRSLCVSEVWFLCYFTVYRNICDIVLYWTAFSTLYAHRSLVHTATTVTMLASSVFSDQDPLLTNMD